MLHFYGNNVVGYIILENESHLIYSYFLLLFVRLKAKKVCRPIGLLGNVLSHFSCTKISLMKYAVAIRHLKY